MIPVHGAILASRLSAVHVRVLYVLSTLLQDSVLYTDCSLLVLYCFLSIRPPLLSSKRQSVLYLACSIELLACGSGSASLATVAACTR